MTLAPSLSGLLRASLAGLALGMVPVVGAQDLESVADPFDARDRATAIDTVLARLERQYVFADVAAAMVEVVTGRRSDLMRLTNPGVFADSLTAILRRVSHDGHLGVYHDSAAFEALSPAPADARPEAPARDDAERRARNYGFGRVEVLDGNVGLIELTRMDDVDVEAGARAVAAMALVADVDALVVDLRQNPGGAGRMNQLLSSYFFADDRWLVTNENRSEGTARQEWTQPYVPGRRMPEVPLYLLVGPQTGSAAEGFAYNLQALGRAVVVGEPTYGAAHSGDLSPLSGGLVAFVPTGRTVNPVTNENWEGSGVQPDVPVEASRALKAALLDVWERRLATVSADAPEADRARWAIETLRAGVVPVAVDPNRQQEVAGLYGGDRRVTILGDALLYQKEGQAPYRMVPLGDDRFALDQAEPYGWGAYRIVFERNATGAVVGMRIRIRHAPTQVAEFTYPRSL